MITWWRLFLASWKNLFRNLWMAMATIFVLVMALLSVNVLLGFRTVVSRVVSLLEDKVDITVTFKPDTPEAVLQQARFYVSSLPQVSLAMYVSADEALQQFKLRHQQDSDVVAGLQEVGANPLGAQLIIKARTANDYPFILQAVKNPQYLNFIQEPNYSDHRDAIAQVERLSENIRLGGAALVAIFSLFGLLIAFNAIRVAMYAQREEMGIMRLVGAPRWFIRGPFMLEGLWLSLAALAVSAILSWIMVDWLEPPLRALLDGADPGLHAVFLTQGPRIALIEALALIGLVLFVSAVAIGRHMKR